MWEQVLEEALGGEEDPSPQGPLQGGPECGLESYLAMPKLGVQQNSHLGLDLTDS